MRILLLLFLVCVFVGCNSSQSRALIDDSNVIVVKIGQIEEKPVDISDFVDSVEFVELETVSESYIDEVEQIMFIDSLVVVIDKKMACLFFFDCNGKYLYKINRRGKGHGEYLDITKTLWDEKSRELIIWSLATRKLMFYTLDGTFIRSIDDFNKRSVVRDIINTAEGGYLCYRRDKSKGATEPDNISGLWKVDSLGNFEQFLIERTTIYPGISSQFLFNLYPLQANGEIGFIDQYSTDIYHADGHTISKFLSFDLPGKRVADFPGVELSTEIKEPFFSLINHTEKEDMVLTEWLDPDMKYFVSLYAKKDKTFCTGRSAFLLLDGQYMPTFMNVATNTPSVMASVISPLTILSILDSTNAPEGMKIITRKWVEGKEVRQIESMNPILMLLHIKKSQIQ